MSSKEAFKKHWTLKNNGKSNDQMGQNLVNILSKPK